MNQTRMSAGRTRLLPWAAMLLLAACSERTADTPTSVSGSNAPRWSAAVVSEYLAKMQKAQAIQDFHLRCISAPDLPGNQWPSDAAKSRCEDLLDGPWPIQALTTTLARTDGPRQLDEDFRSTEAAYAASPRTARQWERAFEAFDRNAEATPLAETWLARSPGSPYAMTALGLVYLSNANRERGNDWIAETPQRQIDSMQRWLDRARPLFESALASDQTLGFACAGLIDIARMTGNGTLKRTTIARCDDANPTLPRYLGAIRVASTPRWSGSWDALTAFDNRIETVAGSHPALAYMRNTQLIERAYELQRSRQRGAALPLLVEVSRQAPHGDAMYNAGRTLQEANRLDEAMVYLSQALRFEPENVTLLNRRISLYQALGDTPRALADIHSLIDTGRANTQTYTKLASLAEKTGDYTTAKDAYEKAMVDNDYRQWGQTGRCDIIVRRESSLENALSCTEGLLSAFPDDTMANFMRAWVLTEHAQPGADEAAQRFFALPDGLDKRQPQMTSELKQLRRRMSRATTH